MNPIPESRIRQHTKDQFAALAAEQHRSVQDALAHLQKALQEHAAVAQAAATISDERVEQLVAGVEVLADDALRDAVSRARDEVAAAAQEELSRTRVQLQQELEAAREDFEKRRQMLESRVAQAERDISTIGRQRDEHAASLQQTAVHLEEETQRRLTLEKQLDTAFHELTRARSQVQSELEAARVEYNQRKARLESQLTEAERDCATTRQHRDELAGALQQAQARIEAAEAASAKAFGESQLVAARLEEEAQRRLALEKQLDTAFHELTRARSQVQKELDAARLEFDEWQAKLESQLAEAERDCATTRQHRDELASSLRETRARIDAAEEGSAKAVLESRLAAARLEEETQRRVAVEKQLDASRQELVLARAEAEARRLELQVAAGPGRATETAASERTPPESPAAESAATERAVTDVDARAILDWLKRGLDALNREPREQLLPSLVEQLKGEFRAAGVFTVSQDGFRLSNTQPEPGVLPSHVTQDVGWLLSRAVSEQAAARVEALPAVETRGLSAQVMAHAIAVPIIVQQRVLAVVYAENAPDRRALGPQLLAAAEILVDCLNRRLNQSSSSAQPEQPAPEVPASPVAPSQAFAVNRQAERLRIAGSVQLLVDGVSSALVDVSTLGAQVLSPSTLRPDRIVRVLLPSGSGAFTCTGRIMWAQPEPAKRDTAPQYRSGIQFIDIHPKAIESFISRQRSQEATLRATAAQLPS